MRGHTTEAVEGEEEEEEEEGWKSEGLLVSHARKNEDVGGEMKRLHARDKETNQGRVNDQTAARGLG